MSYIIMADDKSAMMRLIFLANRSITQINNPSKRFVTSPFITVVALVFSWVISCCRALMVVWRRLIRLWSVMLMLLLGEWSAKHRNDDKHSCCFCSWLGQASVWEIWFEKKRALCCILIHINFLTCQKRRLQMRAIIHTKSSNDKSFRLILWWLLLHPTVSINSFTSCQSVCRANATSVCTVCMPCHYSKWQPHTQNNSNT